MWFKFGPEKCCSAFLLPYGILKAIASLMAIILGKLLVGPLRHNLMSYDHLMGKALLVLPSLIKNGSVIFFAVSNIVSNNSHLFTHLRRLSPSDMLFCNLYS